MDMIFLGEECTAMGIEKYPIPANISTTTSSCATTLISFFSARLPFENITFATSSLKVQPFSLCVVSVPWPAMTSLVGSLKAPCMPLSFTTQLHLGYICSSFSPISIFLCSRSSGMVTIITVPITCQPAGTFTSSWTGISFASSSLRDF